MVGGCVGSKRYVGSKVSVVRWCPSTTHYTATDTFVAATWNDSSPSVGVWRVPETDDDPSLLHSLSHPSSVNDIKYVTRDLFCTAGSGGGVRLYQHTGMRLEEKMVWDGIHSFSKGGAPCTGLATNGEQIASVGEDGRLVILSPEQKQSIRTLESVGGCSLYAAVYVRASEVLTASMQGHLKLWDLRASHPTKATLHSPDQVGVCDLAGHPTQQHLVAAGGEDGALVIWDMRSTTQPFTLITAHNGPICEVRFHPAAPEHLFTCGLDGQLLHWDASASARPTQMTSYKGTREQPGGSATVWLSSDVARGAIDTTFVIPPSPLPINSLDIEGSTLIAGSDNEAIYTVRQVLLI